MLAKNDKLTEVWRAFLSFKVHKPTLSDNISGTTDADRLKTNLLYICV